MSSPLQPIITDAGLTAVWNAYHTGMQCEIAQVALGDESYTPDKSATQLVNEVLRVDISGGELIDPTQIHVTALVSGDTEFWVREVGFFFDDGTLFAIWSDPDQALAYKAEGTDLLLAFDLTLDALPPESVTINLPTQNITLLFADKMLATTVALSEMATTQVNTLHRQLDFHQRLLGLENTPSE